MKSDSAIRVNELLKRYYAAGSASEAVLGEVAEGVRPLIRSFLARKGMRGEDLEDLCGDAIARLTVALRATREPGARHLHDVIGFILTLSRNLYVDHLRRADRWRSLQLYVVKVLSGAERGNPFARWQINAVWLGGFTRWRGQPCRSTPQYLAFWENDSAFRRQALANRHPAEIRLPELMVLLFQWIDTPLEENELVSHLADLRQIGPVVTVSLEALAERSESNPDSRQPQARETPETDVLNAVALSQLGAEVWTEICQLRPLQRAALLLAMEWDDWMRLGWTPISIAEALDISPEAMVDLWRALPLTDRMIAERLGVKEEQVPNLRKCARERLRRRLDRPN